MSAAAGAASPAPLSTEVRRCIVGAGAGGRPPTPGAHGPAAPRGLVLRRGAPVARGPVASVPVAARLAGHVAAAALECSWPTWPAQQHRLCPYCMRDRSQDGAPCSRQRAPLCRSPVPRAALCPSPVPGDGAPVVLPWAPLVPAPFGSSGRTEEALRPPQVGRGSSQSGNAGRRGRGPHRSVQRERLRSPGCGARGKSGHPESSRSSWHVALRSASTARWVPSRQ